MTRMILLGPQVLAPTVGEEAARAGVRGPVALVTAGWQERESEDQQLAEVLGVPAINLRLYARWEDIQRRDPDYFEAHRSRQDRLRRLQSLYRIRLSPLLKTARSLVRTRAPADLIEPERESAVEAVRRLDEHHCARVRTENERFLDELRPFERPVIAEHRADLQRIMADCDAVAVAGGHVSVLLNRMRLFLDPEWLRTRTVLAWSAGAMVLTRRIVLFHDRPPQGAGDAEVLGRGLGLVSGAIVLPHAARRLRLDDTMRVSLMARRFAPDGCYPLEARSRLQWEGDRLVTDDASVRLAEDGTVASGGAA